MEVIKKYDALEMALFIIDMGTTEHCRLITQYDLNLRVMFRYSPRATRPPLWPPDLPFAPSVSGAGRVARWPSVHGEENQYLPRYPRRYIPHLVQGSVDDDALMMSILHYYIIRVCHRNQILEIKYWVVKLCCLYIYSFRQ